MKRFLLAHFLILAFVLPNVGARAEREDEIPLESEEELTEFEKSERLVLSLLAAIRAEVRQHEIAVADGKKFKEEERAKITRKIGELAERLGDAARTIGPELTATEFNELLARLLVRYARDVEARPKLDLFFLKLSETIQSELEEYRQHSYIWDGVNGAFAGSAVLMVARVAKAVGNEGVFRSLVHLATDWAATPKTLAFLERHAGKRARVRAVLGGPWQRLIILAGIGAATNVGLGALAMDAQKMDPVLALGAVQGFILIDQIAIEACRARDELKRELADARRGTDSLAGAEIVRRWKAPAAIYRARLERIERDLELLKNSAKKFGALQPLPLFEVEKILGEKNLKERLARKTATVPSCQKPNLAFAPAELDRNAAEKILRELEKLVVENEFPLP